MDAISASTFNLHNVPYDHRLSKLSLSTYERKDFKNVWPQIFAALIATLPHLQVGISLTYSAILLPQLSEEEDFKSLSDSSKSWIASVFVFATPISSIMTGYIMDSIGRINTLKLSIVPTVLGLLCIALGWNFPMIIIGRALTGFASSLATNPGCVYVTEIARKDMRGSFLSLAAVFISLGMMLSYLLGWVFKWRTVAWICIVYMIFPFILLFFIKESPSWLVSRGRFDEAKESLESLHRHQPQPEDWEESFASLQLKLLCKDKDKSETTSGSNWRGFLKPTGYKPMLIIIGLFTFQQYSGIYIFLFYSVEFFQETKTTVNPYLASVIIGLIRLAMSLISTWLFKIFNRRTLILSSAAMMVVCTAVSASFTTLIKNEQTDASWVPFASLLMYVMASMAGLLSIPWGITAELFPLEIRSVAYSIALALANVIMFTAIQSYTSLKYLLNGIDNVQWFFCAVCAGAIVYSYFLLPETHEKKLSEIEEYFRHNTFYTSMKKKVEEQDNNNVPE